MLLSDKCIPLYNKDKIYNDIIKEGSNILSVSRNNHQRYENMYDKSFLDIGDFAKQSQWCLLDRETVKFFIENDYTDKFGNNFNCPEEHYFINIMKKNNIFYKNRILTYVNCTK